MRIDFDDGGFVEVIKSPHTFDQIYIQIGTKEGPLKLNVNSANINYKQFVHLVSEVLQVSKESDNEHIEDNQGNKNQQADK